MAEIDNQQERLAWLAGIIDGEGNIRLGKREGLHYGSGFALNPSVVITNTSIPALNRITEILDTSNCAYHISWAEPGKDKRTMWLWKLHITGVKRVMRFLEVMLPYLVIKERQAIVLYKYCKSRLERPLDYNGYKARYTTEDEKVHSQLKELNQYPQRAYVEVGQHPQDVLRTRERSRESHRNDDSTQYRKWFTE